MTTRILKPRAEMDLDGILDHLTLEAGSRVARKYALGFDACLDRLSRFPGSGAPRPELGIMTRISIVAPYVVIYEFDEMSDTVTILRITHGRRKITQHTLEY